ncbi:MAG: prephenate dehydrogenase dimerization domain-containing protein, partial [Flavobacteriaceae bacterium]
AVEYLFFNNTPLLCAPDKTAPKLLQRAHGWFASMGMEIRHMDAVEHDKHIAYVSHLSHISSFMLGKTVLEKEKDQSTIIAIPVSRFESSVTIAKCSPDICTPFFKINKDFVLETLNDYIRNLKTFQHTLEQEDFEALYQDMKDINRIKTVLKGITDKNNTHGK